MFRIRVFNSEHTCPLKYGKHISNDIIDDVILDLGIDINYVLAWREKEKALESTMGQPTTSYGKLPAYLYTLNKTFPSSHIRIKKTPANEFLYIRQHGRVLLKRGIATKMAEEEKDELSSHCEENTTNWHHTEQSTTLIKHLHLDQRYLFD
ncbi:hypothetical protein H5410_022404 [Solanum commersonii]|uniref:Uncharacterized protein n=1 Tax=Solanum commersonii TaxID=4109 RepID=A0A9J5ZDW2_SOLCO|nr:hypothetical protein H5410_022404 [Solanum commersonii]